MSPEQLGEFAVETVLHDQREPTGIGPARIIAENVAAAIREAVAAERERCAEIAEDKALAYWNDPKCTKSVSMLNACREVAAAIREGRS